MFGLFKRKHPVVFEQWITPILDFTSNTGKFYDAVEEELKKWQVPELVTERIVFKDGGFLSAGREYLRIRREALVFDICSAPFGRSWWFSCRSAVLPRNLRWWEVWVFLLAVTGLAAVYCHLFGVMVGGIVIGTSLLLLLILMMSASSWNGLDDLLLRLPVLGAFYEAWFRFDSYYRDDAQRMYVSMVDFFVREKVKEFAAAAGIDEVQFNEVKNPLQLVSLGDRVQDVIANGAQYVSDKAQQAIQSAGK
jgi:hypothetical protein